MATPSHTSVSHRTSSEQYWSSIAEARLSTYSHPPNLSAGVTTRIKSQHDMDQELAALEKVIASFRERRNAFSPFSRLPPEVVVQIFSLHAENQPPAPDEISWNDSEGDVPSLSQIQLGWITVTHVCRQWRAIALSHPNLWTNIAFSLGDRWVEEMLNRAKSAPIVYKRKGIKGRSSLSDSDISALRTNLHHIRSLTLSGDDDGISRILRALMTAAPLLETLTLDSTAHASFPDHVFDGQAPSLRQLSISGMNLRWDLFLFRNLRSLFISVPLYMLPMSVDEISWGAPTHQQLLSIVALMPELQSLSLLHCLPPHKTHLPDDHSVVDLPWLQRLRLEGSSFQCLNMMQSLSIPESCILDIEVWRFDREPDIFDLILSLAAVHLRRAPDSNLIETLCVDTTTIEPRLFVCGYSSTCMRNGLPLFPQSSLDKAELPAFRLHLRWRRFLPDEAEIFCNLVRRMFASFAFDTLRSLSFPITDDKWTQDDWRAVVGPLVTLEHVHVKGRGAITLARTLLDRIPDAYHSQPDLTREAGRLFLPRLTSVKLDGVNFRVRPDSENPDVGFYELLPQVLSQRRALGAGVRALVLEECNVRPSWVARLREVVPRVEWDSYDYWDELEGF